MRAANANHIGGIGGLDYGGGNVVRLRMDGLHEDRCAAAIEAPRFRGSEAGSDKLNPYRTVIGRAKRAIGMDLHPRLREIEGQVAFAEGCIAVQCGCEGDGQ